MNKDKRFGMVLSSDEEQALKELAEMEGLSEAALVRRLIRLAAKDKGLWPVKSK